MIYLLDSDILIDFFKLKEPAIDIIQEVNTTGKIAISTVTITELRSGWKRSEANRLLQQLYNMCIIKPVTKEVAEQAGIWRQEYSAKGLQLNTVDTIIAATSIIYNYCLVTNNTKDYPMPEINLYQQ